MDVKFRNKQYYLALAEYHNGTKCLVLIPYDESANNIKITLLPKPELYVGLDLNTISSYIKDKDVVFIKDYGSCKGAYESLKQQGILSDKLYEFNSGIPGTRTIICKYVGKH